VSPARSAAGAAEVQGGPAAETSKAPAMGDYESTADLREYYRHRHYSGFVTFIALSLDLLGTAVGGAPDHAAAITQQSATIASIRADMHAAMLLSYDAERKLLFALADGVAVGNVDTARVDADLERLSTAAAGVELAAGDSLVRLHAALTPGQRAALVAKVEAQFEVSSDVNAADESADRDAHGGHLGKLAGQLSLSPDQVEMIRARFRSSAGVASHPFDRQESEKYLWAFRKAFAGDAFDAKTLSADTAASAHLATWGATRMADFYEAVGPVLTPAQRTLLAGSLRRHADGERT